MMTRKKRRTLVVVIIAVILLIIAVACVLLYVNTDMFKSSQTLFLKYTGKGIENLGTITQVISNEYDEQLETNPYTSNTQIKVNYIENLGTTAESTENSINSLQLTIDGQTNKQEQYDYKNIKLLKDNNQEMRVEYIQENNNYGLRFSDLFNQFAMIENSNLKNLYKNMGYTDEEVANIPDSISINENLFNDINFSSEEIETLKEKYLNVITQNISKDNFSKLSNQNITINNQSYIADGYALTLTKEQLNNMYVNLLETLKQDEIILGKIDNLQNKINTINLYQQNSTINIKDEFVNSINQKIQEINQSNIGSDQTQITAYEMDGQTAKIAIKTAEYEIDFDSLGNNGFLQLSLIKGENTSEIILERNTNETDLTIQTINEEGKPIKITYSQTNKIDNKNETKNYSLIYEDDEQRVNASIVQNISIVQNLENKVSTNEENAVTLNNLEQGQLQQITNNIKTALNNKLETVRQDINISDINNMLINIGLIRDESVLESTVVTETEKNRYNSKYELLQGENLKSEDISRIVDTIKSNLVNLEVVSSQELKLKIDRHEGNEEMAKVLNDFLEDNSNQEYNLKVEYGDDGLVSALILTMVEKN